MRIPLDNAFDTHFVYVDRCHETTLNIVIQVYVDRHFQEKQLRDSVDALARKHPYLLGRVCEDYREYDGSRFFLEPQSERHLSCQIQDIVSGELEEIMDRPSQRRSYRFNLNAGELAHVQVWQDGTVNIIEFSCVHLIGDVTAILILFSDLLLFLDQSIDGTLRVNEVCHRLTFDEKRYGWEMVVKEIKTLQLPKDLSPRLEKWRSPNFKYKRFSLPISRFNNVKQWLERKQINAKATDVFSYVAARVCAEAYKLNLNMLAVLTYRHILRNRRDVNNINTSTLFAKIEVPDEYLSDIKEWIEFFYMKRRAAITAQGVMEFIYFLRCLNESMRDGDIQYGRALINAFIPMDRNFALNNLGNINPYLKENRHFRIMDIDIQDGVPAQEVRIFGYGDRLHMNGMLDPNGPVSVEEFLTTFDHDLEQLIQSPC